MLTIAAFATTFVACDSKKEGTENTTTADSTAVEAAAPAEGDVLAKYEALVDKAIPLLEKVQKGDAAATQEYTQIAQEIANLSTDLQKEVATLTPEQATKFAEIGKKFAEAAQPK